MNFGCLALMLTFRNAEAKSDIAKPVTAIVSGHMPQGSCDILAHWPVVMASFVKVLSRARRAAV
jgi:hypothetical protein